MALKGDGASLMLRPMNLRPGGGTAKNPFERFAKGAGTSTSKPISTDVVPQEEEKRKPRSEVIQYTREQLEAFQEKYIQAPPELENCPEIQINTIEPIRQAQAQADTRDWRGRADTSSSAQQSDWQNKQSSGNASTGDLAKSLEKAANGEQGRPSQANGQNSASTSSQNLQANRMQKAEELGRVAWQAGATKEGNQRTLKEVKGILNKLTPEKFDILSKQLIQLVTNKEVLHTTITMLFETAVAQPAFVTVYADLASNLSQALPESLTGPDKTQSFRSILLNICQEEFEGVATAREKLASIPARERADAERQVKTRSLGNIKFIAELFNKGIVTEKIVLICIEVLLNAAKAEPKEDNVEVLCELMTKAGKKLDATTKNKAKFDGFFTSLDRLSKHKQLPPRMKFMVRDVLDLRKSSWIPRRDVLQAKKIGEIHAEAHAELGMVPTTQLPMFNALPALPQAVVGPREEVQLFPAFRGGDDGWAASGKLQGLVEMNGVSHRSAFYLDVDPLASRTKAQPSAEQPQTQPQAETKAKREPLKNLSDEQRESRGKSLFSDYISTQNVGEATEAFEELNVPGFAPKLVGIGLTRMLAEETENSRRLIADVLIKFLKAGVLESSDLWQPFKKEVSRIQDTTMDAPYAPKALSYTFVSGVVEEVADLNDLESQLKDVEDVYSRREYGQAVLKNLQEREGAEKAQQLCKEAKLEPEKLFKADEEVDGPGVESVEDFLKSANLQSLF